MEKPDITNLGERIKENQNKEKREKLDVTPDGYFLYPEEKIEITANEALEIADDIIKKYSDPQALFEDFLNKETAKQHGLYEEKSDGELVKKMEESLISQRKQVEILTTEELIRILALHGKYPAHYYGTLILSSAEELKRRFNP